MKEFKNNTFLSKMFMGNIFFFHGAHGSASLWAPPSFAALCKVSGSHINTGLLELHVKKAKRFLHPFFTGTGQFMAIKTIHGL